MTFFKQNRVNKVEEVLDMEREEHIKAIAACQEEIQRLSEKFNMQLQKTQDLHDNQKSLRKEIERYRKLLEGEESRYINSCSKKV